MLISYEVPMALAVTGVVILASATLLSDASTLSAMSLTGIVQGQPVVFALVQPLGFLVFMTAASAEMSRAPFDMIEAESELGAGYHTEYSGIKFAIFQLAEFMAPIITAAIAAVLFLGGARDLGPIPGQVMFLAKAFLVVALLLWVRSTWPRLRVDQIMGFAWKALFPLSLVNMFLIAVGTWVLQDPRDGRNCRRGAVDHGSYKLGRLDCFSDRHGECAGSAAIEEGDASPLATRQHGRGGRLRCTESA